MDILAEFKNMHSNLASKQNSFSHCELPNSLIKTTEMKKKKQPPTIDLTPNIPKRPKVINNPNNWNPKLRDALQQPLREARNPSFTKILKFCNVEANAVLKGSTGRMAEGGAQVVRRPDFQFASMGFEQYPRGHVHQGGSWQYASHWRPPRALGG